MTEPGSAHSKTTSRARSQSGWRVAVHALLLIYALILAYVVAGLVFNYSPNPNFYFGLSLALLLFALAQCFYEFRPGRALLFLAVTSLIGFVFEVLGTNTGFLFGKYSYAQFLGQQILGVPIVVPFSWFVIVYITFSLTLSNYPAANGNQRGSNNFSALKLRRFVLPIFLACFGSVAWDLMIDPMFTSYGYWTWKISSSTPQFYHVPLSNFFGWFVVAFLMLICFVLIFKYTSKGSAKLLLRENTWDSRIAYILLMIDAGVANGKLGQYYAVWIGVLAMCTFLVLTSKATKYQKKGPPKQERTAEIRDQV
jgi:uncharacterized membrane protein